MPQILHGSSCPRRVSRLGHVVKLAASAFAPVPSPTGGALRTDEPAASESWAFFDLSHLHAIESAPVGNSERIMARPAGANDSPVFTSPDLAPDIEADVHHELYSEDSPEKM